MPLPTRVFLLGITVLIALSTTIARTQQSADPHLPPPQSVAALNEFIRIDDMLLSPEHYEQLTAPATSHLQANPIFHNVRRNQWDFGVIAYEIAPNFSDAERQRVFDAMNEWMR